jgi:hypothetical protein
LFFSSVTSSSPTVAFPSSPSSRSMWSGSRIEVVVRLARRSGLPGRCSPVLPLYPLFSLFSTPDVCLSRARRPCSCARGTELFSRTAGGFRERSRSSLQKGHWSPHLARSCARTDGWDHRVTWLRSLASVLARSRRYLKPAFHHNKKNARGQVLVA